LIPLSVQGDHVNKLLHGRTAVVTGAAQGIGFAIATTLAAQGAFVLVADLDPDRTTAAAAAIASGHAIGVACDVTVEDDMQRLVDSAASETGRLDIWVNNAGITRDSSLKKLSLDDFRRVLDVHLTGSWLGIRAASSAMRERRTGSIISMSSLSGKSGNPGQTNYSAAKAGIVGLTKAAAKELAHHNIRVNAVAPGLIRTPMTEAMPADVFSAREAEVPMRRAGEPHEVADAVLFLGSDLSSYITGTVIEVGGGRYI
jgi:3-oxoacyl-[acyl-carrier protein] reductase